MTTLWRCCKRSRLATAFSGDGGRHHDGRWHRSGRRIVYMSDEASLALVEVLVNGWSLDQALRMHVLVSCELPEDLIHAVDRGTLPADWDATTPTGASQGWGDAWLRDGRYPAVRVPSAVMPGTNVLVNPEHPAIARRLVPHGTHHEWNPRLVRVAKRA